MTPAYARKLRDEAARRGLIAADPFAPIDTMERQERPDLSRPFDFGASGTPNELTAPSIQLTPAPAPERDPYARIERLQPGAFPERPVSALETLGVMAGDLPRSVGGWADDLLAPRDRFEDGGLLDDIGRYEPFARDGLVDTRGFVPALRAEAGLKSEIAANIDDGLYDEIPVIALRAPKTAGQRVGEAAQGVAGATLATGEFVGHLGDEVTFAPFRRLSDRYGAVDDALSVADHTGAMDAARGSAGDAVFAGLNLAGAGLVARGVTTPARAGSAELVDSVIADMRGGADGTRARRIAELKAELATASEAGARTSRPPDGSAANAILLGGGAGGMALSAGSDADAEDGSYRYPPLPAEPNGRKLANGLDLYGWPRGYDYSEFTPTGSPRERVQIDDLNYGVKIFVEAPDGRHLGIVYDDAGNLLGVLPIGQHTPIEGGATGPDYFAHWRDEPDHDFPPVDEMPTLQGPMTEEVQQQGWKLGGRDAGELIEEYAPIAGLALLGRWAGGAATREAPELVRMGGRAGGMTLGGGAGGAASAFARGEDPGQGFVEGLAIGAAPAALEAMVRGASLVHLRDLINGAEGPAAREAAIIEAGKRGLNVRELDAGGAFPSGERIGMFDVEARLDDFVDELAVRPAPPRALQQTAPAPKPTRAEVLAEQERLRRQPADTLRREMHEDEALRNAPQAAEGAPRGVQVSQRIDRDAYSPIELNRQLGRPDTVDVPTDSHSERLVDTFLRASPERQVKLMLAERAAARDDVFARIPLPDESRRPILSADGPTSSGEARSAATAAALDEEIEAEVQARLAALEWQKPLGAAHDDIAAQSGIDLGRRASEVEARGGGAYHPVLSHMTDEELGVYLELEAKTVASYRAHRRLPEYSGPPPGASYRTPAADEVTRPPAAGPQVVQGGYTQEELDAAIDAAIAEDRAAAARRGRKRPFSSVSSRTQGTRLGDNASQRKAKAAEILTEAGETPAAFTSEREALAALNDRASRDPAFRRMLDAKYAWLIAALGGGALAGSVGEGDAYAPMQ